MNELNCDGSFSDAGSHALHGTMPDIANGKYARNICFQQKGIAVLRPALRTLTSLHDIGAGKNEPAIITLDRRRQASPSAGVHQ